MSLVRILSSRRSLLHGAIAVGVAAGLPWNQATAAVGEALGLGHAAGGAQRAQDR